MLIDNKKFDMDGIRTVVYGLAEVVRERLYVELIFADDDTVPIVDIGSLADNPASVTGGYRECRRCVGMVADGSDTELCTYG